MRAIIITLLCIAVLAVKKEEFLDKPILAETDVEADLAQGTYQGVYMLYNRQKASVIDILGAKKDNNIEAILYRSHGGNSQKFHVWKNNKGYYIFKAVHSGKAVSSIDKKDGSKIKQYAYDGNDSQLWKLESYKGMWVFIKNKKSGKVLDYGGYTSGYPQVIQKSHEKKYVYYSQHWALIKVG